MRGTQVLEEEDWNRISSDFDAFEKNKEWLEKQKPELMKRYANQYIAVDNGRVLDANPDAEALLDALRSTFKHLNRIVIEFIPEEGMMFIY